MKIFYYRNNLKNHLLENNISSRIHLSIQHKSNSYQYSFSENFDNFFKKTKELKTEGRFHLHELLLTGQKKETLY